MLNILLGKKSSLTEHNKYCESKDDIISELDKIIVTMHGISSDAILTTLIEVEEEVIKALFDSNQWHNLTRNPLTIIGKKRCPNEMPAK